MGDPDGADEVDSAGAGLAMPTGLGARRGCSGSASPDKALSNASGSAGAGTGIEGGDGIDGGATGRGAVAGPGGGISSRSWDASSTTGGGMVMTVEHFLHLTRAPWVGIRESW